MAISTNMAVTKYKYKDYYRYKMYFIFILGEKEICNFLLAVAKHYIYKNKLSDKQLNFHSESQISM